MKYFSNLIGLIFLCIFTSSNGFAQDSLAFYTHSFDVTLASYDIVPNNVTSVTDKNGTLHFAYVEKVDTVDFVKYQTFTKEGVLSQKTTVGKGERNNAWLLGLSMIVDNENNPHFTWLEKRDGDKGNRIGNYAIIYAFQENGSWIKEEVTTNPNNPDYDEFGVEDPFYTRNNNRPGISLNLDGSIQILYSGAVYVYGNPSGYGLVLAKRVGSNSWEREVFVPQKQNSVNSHGMMTLPNRMTDQGHMCYINLSDTSVRVVYKIGDSYKEDLIEKFTSTYDNNDCKIEVDDMGKIHMIWYNTSSDTAKYIDAIMGEDGIESYQEYNLKFKASGSLMPATIDPVSGKTYLFYSRSFSPLRYLIEVDKAGDMKEYVLEGLGLPRGRKVISAYNGVVNIVTATNSKIFITSTSSIVENNTTAFDGKYSGKVSQEGVHIGTFSFDVSGTTLSGNYNGFDVDFSFEGAVNESGEVDISIFFAGDNSTTTVNASISGENLSGTWTNNLEGESGSVLGSKATQEFDGRYVGDVLVSGTEVGTFDLTITDALLSGTYLEEGTSYNINGYTNINGDISFNMYFEEDLSISTINASIEGNNLTGTFSNTLGDSGTISGSKTETVSNEIENEITRFVLNQNYPNPFNPSTNISFEIPKSSEVTLEVFDMLGRKVVSLVNERKAAGSYTVPFYASSLSSGMYIYRLQAGSFIQTRKLTLIK